MPVACRGSAKVPLSEMLSIVITTFRSTLTREIVSCEAVDSLVTCTAVDFSVMTFSFFIVHSISLPSPANRPSKLVAHEAKRGLILGHLQH